jgi:hypothetical protein
METVNSIELHDASVYPDESVLRKVLGPSYGAYCSLLKLYEDNGLEAEWRYYLDGKAWLCKVQRKGKTIVWMSAWKDYMQATIYFPERHIEGICSLDIAPATRDRILSTKNTGKSKPCIFEIRDDAVLKDFNTVLQLKLIAK